eukprot:TRINITY_DN36217_c0_g1_i1.p1 TRINITY_DN36217_c0_g1~~TRINITY_DN36217_c0_g1_i1.p1  ORF type:complete len:180 (-),score=83.01 TRINITY_DN36217_c0_g1_i1:457-936(-)
MRVISVIAVVLALAVVASAASAPTAAHKAKMASKVLKAREDESNNYVFAEIVDNLVDNNPVNTGFVETTSQVTQIPQQQVPYYPGAVHVGYPQFAHPYVGMQPMGMRFAAPASPMTPYTQFGYPYSSMPPVPPAMPTYLPPPPYVPQHTGAGEAAATSL